MDRVIRATERIESVDLLRGIVMAIMTLDHVRDFFSNAGFDPTDLDQTTPAFFATRWITHFCAPVFVFLAGTGAYLSRRPKPELAKFLVTRGLWLVFLEIIWVRAWWTWHLLPGTVVLQVIWALGCSMVALAVLVFLPLRVLTVFAVAMIGLHDALDGVHAETLGSFKAAWLVAHESGVLSQPGPSTIYVAYPLVPWIGVMAAGYAFGALLQGEAALRRRRVAWLGGAVLLLFVVLRTANVYGDPQPWSVQARGAIFTFISFLNCSKYPPSLLYLAMTLGPALLVLSALDRPGLALARAARPFLVLGRVPLFFYLLHLPLIHAAALVAGRNGYGLGTVYVVWLAALALLYGPCHWFAEVKRRNRSAWLSYL
ncbi:heparan-alpha-glucosaminide N-acetyltransferase domain-containing protein [Pendulispora brunnea]|uniref:Heparan-alpha-glucosaminide N-acetyltransferase domain-containing protein n=1 Tax=Pendulispora brunnea TaxID=2905690 RepID=A0ABZ2K0Y2_9BACT